MFHHALLPNGFELTMSSELTNVDTTIGVLHEYLIGRSHDVHFFALSLLAREALNNAMIHGNGSDVDKQVIMRLVFLDGCYVMDIEDQGRGFNWIQHINTVAGEDDESGRGHEIYRSYARDVRYNVHGNIIRLEYEV